ncbi:MAG: hypothetical protein ABIK09_02385 [Pseudomonadota bacterium]
MVDDKKPVDSLLSSLEEIKRETSASDAASRKAAREPKPAAAKPRAGSDLLGSLLSEVKREADEEQARLDQTLASREEERRLREREEEDQKRAKYQKLVQEESGRRQAQLRQKEDRAQQALLEEEQRIKAEAEKIALAKAMVVLEKKRKRQRVVNLVVAAVVVVAAGVALSITRPWERTEPLKGIEEVEVDTYVARKADFTPMYNASDRGDPSFIEPRHDVVVKVDDIPAIEAFAWLLQGEIQSVRPDRRLPPGRVLLADADSYRVQLEKSFAAMTWLEQRGGNHRPSNGSSGVKPPDTGLQLDLSAFGQKDKKKKK